MRSLKQWQTRKVLTIASVVTFIGFLDTHLLIPVMSLYALSLDASVSVTGLIIGLYSITNTPANILFGRLIDRIGYKVPLIAGLIGDTLGMFLYSLCRLPVHLALVRVFHGISGGLIGPATMSIATNYADRTQKGRTMSIYGMSLATATLVGYGLGGVIIDWKGYEAVFYFGAAMLAFGVVISFLLPGSNIIKTTNTARALSNDTLKQIKSLLKKKGLVISYCAIFAQYFTFGGLVTLLPIYVKDLGMEAFHVGMLLATFAITFIIFQFPSGVLSDRVGRLIPTISALILVIVSLAILPVLTTFLLLAVAMALYGVAYGLLFPSISALIADHTVSEERGIATGIFHALLTVGVAVGAPLMGWVGEMVGVELGLMVVPAIMLIPLVITLITLKRT